jgi:hypothetical protein
MYLIALKRRCCVAIHALYIYIFTCSAAQTTEDLGGEHTAANTASIKMRHYENSAALINFKMDNAERKRVYFALCAMYVCICTYMCLLIVYVAVAHCVLRVYAYGEGERSARHLA